ncbi:MAG: S41 family peptidase [Flavobacteriales bacterium]|jgi:carboxyl-terminal processing protease|nr:S41 family peptidase [Flavobacteriales bacterium]MBT6175027.1 S41 family peptidase [Flavobacteriales bacterium]MBT7653394.1 S41 family peptidase [Flavobacteriales bacterium]
MSQSKQPLVIAITLALGLMLGKGCEDGSLSSNSRVGSRISHILDQIEVLYVDSINRETLVDVAVEAIVDELDPHTYYFSRAELEEMAAPMEGNFEGIGVEFIIQNDTLIVVNAIAGGPSESAGIRSGDRIVKVGDEEISGVNLTNKRVMELLKGARGTKVDLSLLHSSSNEEYDVEIVRDRIPIHSVVASFIIEEDVGYIKVIRFSATTAAEFAEAMHNLERDGATSVIVDLRANGGGYMSAATDMIDRFLDQGLGIVYTEGKASPRRDYVSKYDGEYRNWPIAVLIDESSASASEIFAGAMQDNDRGLIVGRRSFGKGLVQEEFEVPNSNEGSGALRLTVARFYTPSGRAIQKPYGEGVDYDHDYEDRLQSGELFLNDSVIKTDSVVYRTLFGREVYGGGGITPDIFIPLDSTIGYRALAELVWTGVLRDAAFKWVDDHRGELVSRTSDNWIDSQTGGMALIKSVAEDQGTVWPKISSEEGRIQIERIMSRFYAQVVKNLYGDNAYYKILINGDDFTARALYELLQNDRFKVRDGGVYLLYNDSTNHSLNL